MQPTECSRSHAEVKYEHLSHPVISACHEENAEVGNILLRSWILKLFTKIVQAIFLYLHLFKGLCMY